jgi:hypothetical protein
VWQAAYPVIAFNTWRHYGDLQLIEVHWGGLVALMDYWLRQPCCKGTLNLCGGLGDWVDVAWPVEITPAQSTSAFYTTLAMAYMSEMAAALGNATNARKYAAMFANASAEYRAEFFDATTGRWDGGHSATPDKYKLVTCNASSGRLGGLVPEEGGGTSTGGPMELRCQLGSGTISKIIFASYGKPTLSHDCQTFAVGSCGANTSQAVVEKLCLGKTHCTIHPDVAQFGVADPCPGQIKYLAVVAEGCTPMPKNETPPAAWLGSQTSLVMPLALNLAAPALARNSGPVHAGAELAATQATLIANIQGKGNHTDSGIIGATFVFDVLNAAGRGDVVLAMLLNDSFPSYGHMIAEGATTLWENWQGSLPQGAKGSNNHIMFGGGVGTIPYTGFGGLSNGRLAAGWEGVEIRPMPPVVEALPFASAVTRTPRGTASVSWSRASGVFVLNASVPVGAVANVAVPAKMHGVALGTVTEAGVEVWAAGHYKHGAAGFKGASAEVEPYAVVVFVVGSGVYNLLARY